MKEPHYLQPKSECYTVVRDLLMNVMIQDENMTWCCQVPWWINCRMQLFEQVQGSSQEFIAPVVQALVAVSCLLGIGSSGIFQPIDKKFLVLLEDQELSKYNIGLEENKNEFSSYITQISEISHLVESFFDQTISEDFTDSSQICYFFIAHGLSNKVAMFLRS